MQSSSSLRRTMLLVLLMALVASAWMSTGARADTPANCTYDQVVPGAWTFSLGPSYPSNEKINCSVPFQAAETVTFKLGYPDVVYDQNGNKGFFTLIYNQGFEVRINGRSYFSFFAYDTLANGTVVSYCGQTYIGWAHNDDQTNWQCYTGTMASPSSSMTASVTPAVDEDLLTRPFTNDQARIDAINAAQTMWTARAYPQWEGVPMRDMVRRAGGRALPSQATSLRSSASSAAPSAALLEAARSSSPSGRVEARAPAGFDRAVLPESFDWRNVSGVNYVSPVRDQGQCGSCYIFSSMAMLEARVRIQTANAEQPVFSTQEPVSCSPYSQGCDGGFPYLIGGKYSEDFGVVPDSCFPYTGVDTPCSQRCTNATRWRIVEDYYYVGGYYGATTAELMQYEVLTNGPIAVGFEVYDDFYSYSGGVYSHSAVADSSSKLSQARLQQLGFNPFALTNHAVLIVGWGVLNGQRYWMVKNSWGTDWGLDGYFMIARDTGVYGGECGIESLAVAATVRV